MITVTPNTNYDLYALVRGEIDGDGSIGYYQLRAYYYDSGGQYISYQTAVSRAEGTLTPAWEEGGGQVTTPVNAATLRVYIYNYNSSGWTAVDNVRLSKTTDSTIKRSSYGIAGQVVATRVSGDPVSGNNGLSYFYSDHLGSSSALQKPDGSVAYTWHLPFGGYRPGSAHTQTGNGRDFTGQRENMELGLLYYNARYYVPGLGRFASPDSIIPNPTNPQSYNRYSYVRIHPLTLLTRRAIENVTWI
ncbi:MAG: hypothetical protein HC804_03390 [Anaerolineae bacterium]|nr:hypothetical protein [Anaerolineae bacterium]